MELVFAGVSSVSLRLVQNVCSYRCISATHAASAAGAASLQLVMQSVLHLCSKCCLSEAGVAFLQAGAAACLQPRCIFSTCTTSLLLVMHLCCPCDSFAPRAACAACAVSLQLICFIVLAGAALILSFSCNLQRFWSPLLRPQIVPPVTEIL